MNQDCSQADVEFWRQLLESDDVALVNAGVAGLRESGWENACFYLPAIEEAYRQHPDLGDFSEEIMLLVDTYPSAPWPDCARDHLDVPVDSEVWQLIQAHAKDRYVPEIAEEPAPAGTALDIVQKSGKADEVKRRHEQFEPASPALAIAGLTRQRCSQSARRPVVCAGT